jgi:cathepsin F
MIVFISKCEEIKKILDLSISDEELIQKFDRFLKRYKKVYDTMEEFNNRYQIFKINYFIAINQTIEHENEDDESIRMGTTPFSDLTEEEFAKNYLSNLNTTEILNDVEIFKYEEEIISSVNNTNSLEFLSNNKTRNLQQYKKIPNNWDWRNHKAVTSVKLQANCGGCWAFSAAANIEGQYAKKYKNLVSFSEQQMLDCDYSNSGCNGGIMHMAFNNIRKSGGLMKRSNYPFTGYRGVCKLRLSQVAVRIRSYMSAGTTSESEIKKFLYKTGPLSITVNARTWQFYKGGVYNVPYFRCPYNPDHGVTLVGYGVTAAGMKYWIIKNSWGVHWGENGYIRIRRGTGLCGVNQYVYSAIIA